MDLFELRVQDTVDGYFAPFESVDEIGTVEAVDLFSSR